MIKEPILLQFMFIRGEWLRWFLVLAIRNQTSCITNYQANSILQIAEIRLNLRPNLFRLFLYLSDMILNRLIMPITFSFTTLALESPWFFCLYYFVKGFLFVFFFGKSDLLCSFCMPWYPVSVVSSVSNNFYVRIYLCFRLFKQPKIMTFTICKSGAYDFFRLFIHDNLCL